MTIKIKLCDNTDQICVPECKTSGAAAYDLRSTRIVRILPMQWELIPTGICIQLPKGVVGLICSRSGMALNKGLFVLNSPGIIDSDYRGQIAVIVFNASNEAIEINQHDRIAQLLFTRHETPTFEMAESLDATERSINGFGSTGNQ